MTEHSTLTALPVGTHPQLLLPGETENPVTALAWASTPVMVWWGPQFQQAYNEAFAHLMGDKHPEALGAPAAETWKEVWDEVSPIVERVRDTGQIFSSDEFRLLIDRHGALEETFWTVSITPVHSEAPCESDGLLILARETTAEVIASRRMHALRRLGSVSAVHTGDAVAVADEGLRALEDCAVDLPWRAIVLTEGSDTRIASPLVAHGTIPGGWGAELPLGAVIHELTAGRSGPSESCDGLWMLPLPDYHGQLLGGLLLAPNPYAPLDEDYQSFLSVVRDQFARLLNDARLHEREAVRLERLSQLDSAKNRMFEDISHDLRAPLSIVQMPLQSILGRLDSTLTADERADLTTALAATRRLQRLVDSLLDVAQGEAGKLVAHPLPVDVAQLTRDAAGMLRGAAEGAGLELRLKVPDMRAVKLDEELWTRIVVNLVSNAVKYTEAGHVCVELAHDGDELQLIVTDTGIGIAADDVSRIFERFRQVATSRRSSEGYGVGLAVVRELLSALGGRIDVSSTVGRGTTFTVVIPAQWADFPVDGIPTDELIASRGERSSGTTHSDRSITSDEAVGTVLIVEDDPDLADIARRLLERAGLRVDHVSSAEQALAHQGHIDLILMDVRLPGMSGFDLLRAIRQSPRLRFLPAVLLTAQADTESVVLGLQAGADDYITKPFAPSEFTARISSHLQLGLHRNSLLQSTETRAANLERALVSNRTIGAALGIIMARAKVTQDDAFGMLRDYSQSTNRKLRDVAEEVVMTGSLPAGD